MYGAQRKPCVLKPCGHVVCQECWAAGKKKGKKCPVCQADVRKVDLEKGKLVEAYFSEQVEVVVKSVSDGRKKKSTVSVKRDMTVDQVKELLENDLSIPVNEQVLVVDSVQMRSGDRLFLYDIVPGKMIKVMIQGQSNLVTKLKKIGLDAVLFAISAFVSYQIWWGLGRPVS
jgi:hypothetical protein